MNGFLLEPAEFSLVTSSTTARGYRASNTGRDNPGMAWKSRGNAAEWLAFDLGADTAIDTITLHGLLDASTDWQVTVDLATSAQGSFTGSYWTGAAQDLLAGSAMPVGNKGRGIWMAPESAPASARYVRLNFSALDAAIEIGRVAIGKRIQLAQNFSYGAALGVRPLGSVEYNIAGVPIVRKGAKLRGIGLTCEGATREETETLVMPFLERVGNDNGVVLVVDPEVDEQRQNRMYFGFLTGDLGTVWPGYNRFVWNANLVAVD